MRGLFNRERRRAECRMRPPAGVDVERQLEKHYWIRKVLFGQGDRALREHGFNAGMISTLGQHISANGHVPSGYSFSSLAELDARLQEVWNDSEKKMDKSGTVIQIKTEGQ